MRNAVGETPQLSEDKEKALEEVYGEKPYDIVNEKMVILEGGQQVIVVNATEKQSIEVDTFFTALTEMGSDLIACYLPEDVEKSTFMKYIELVIADDELDQYHTCRFIQQLIDFDRYIADMFDSTGVGQSPITSSKVEEVDVEQPTAADEENLTPLKYFVIPLDLNPYGTLEEKCKEWHVDGLLIVPQGQLGALEVHAGTDKARDIIPEYHDVTGATQEEMFDAIEQKVQAMGGGKAFDPTSQDTKMYITILCRSIDEVPVANSEDTVWNAVIAILGTTSKATPKEA